HAINPILIEKCRWDPITGGASAVMATTTDLTTSILGTFYKPIQEFQDYHERRKDRPSSSRSHQALQRPERKLSVRSMSTNDEMEPLGLNSANSIGSITTTASDFKNRPDLGGGRLFGLRNLPRYYGEEPRNHGPVTDIKSGFTVAGKGFAVGMAEAFSDIVVKPQQGLQEDDASGAFKGIGKGMANMAPKAGCAMLGLIVDPGAGIARSIRLSIHSRTRKMIAKARHSEAIWLLESGQYTGTDNIVATFQQKLKGKKG
ncbi:hypothetical protein ETB97_011377, partial [Aspergillus alliaceus]